MSSSALRDSREATPSLGDRGWAWPPGALSAVWEGCAVPLVLVDPAGVVRSVNPAFARLTGAAAVELVGRSAWDLMPAEVGLAAVTGAEESVTSTWRVPEQVLVDAVGNRRRVAWSLISVALGPHEQRFILATGVDLTPERAVQETLREQAERDPLTGLANRAFLLRALAGCLDPFRGAGAGLLFCDLDGFKAINDTYGHATGDGVLQESARRLTRLIRPGDIAARFGGDEFVVLVQAGGGFDAHALATRLERAVARPIRLEDQIVRVGVSIGVKVADVGHDPEQVLRDADVAMYAAKQARRARTRPQ